MQEEEVKKRKGMREGRGCEEEELQRGKDMRGGGKRGEVGEKVSRRVKRRESRLQGSM